MNAYLAGALLWAVLAASAAAQRPPAEPFEIGAPRTESTQIDRLVFARCTAKGIRPANPCSDAVFLRRVYLDVIGTLPTPEEADQFLRDRGAKKRRRLIERLLERPEFAEYWAMKWCDLLRVKSEFPINLWPNAVQAYHRWIRDSLRENTPYDQFTRELLTQSGSAFRVPAVNFYRAMQSREPASIASTVALTFMGVRAEQWPEGRLSDMAVFFSQIGFKRTGEWKEEIVFFDPRETAGGPEPLQGAVFPDGTPARLMQGEDPREAFADWLLARGNPWFANAIANRVWAWLLGRGIVHEPDDMRPDNPPSNPALLAFLARKLVSSRYDLKQLFSLILNSRTYQLSSIPASTHPDAAALFAHYPLRRLEAEVLIDALCQVTGTSETYWSPIPEPFTFIPNGDRAIALADGSISSPWLEMFGRSPRDTGLASERNNLPTAAQRLHLLNSTHVRQKIERGPKLGAAPWAGRDLKKTAERFYLAILSRRPTEAEVERFLEYDSTGVAKGRNAAIDLAWALVNSTEFQYRH